MSERGSSEPVDTWLWRHLHVPHRPSPRRLLVLALAGNVAYAGFLLVVFWAAVAYGGWAGVGQPVPDWTWRAGITLVIVGTAVALLTLLTAPRPAEAPPEPPKLDTRPWLALLVAETAGSAVLVTAVSEQSSLRWVPLALGALASTVALSVGRQP